MKNKTLWYLWAGLYAVTCGLAFLPEPTGFLYGLLAALSVGFFAPPAVLLYRAIRDKRWATVRTFRSLSIVSLSLTLAVLILTFLAAGARAQAALGIVLQVLLIFVSAPMICGQIWAISLFCWACLLMVCLQYRKKK